MLDGSREDIGNGLDPAVRMPGKTSQVIFGYVVAKIVEE
jgi:hypothetical protein